MPLSNDVLMSLVNAGICADDVFFIISVSRGSKEHVVDLLDLIITSFCCTRFFEVVKCGCSRSLSWFRSKLVTGTLATSARIRSILAVKKAKFSQSYSPSPS